MKIIIINPITKGVSRVHLHTVLFKIRKSARSSKRFRRLFHTFEALSGFWPREILGQFSSTQNCQKVKNASKVRKNPRKRLLRRLKIWQTEK